MCWINLDLHIIIVSIYAPQYASDKYALGPLKRKPSAIVSVVLGMVNGNVETGAAAVHLGTTAAARKKNSMSLDAG